MHYLSHFPTQLDNFGLLRNHSCFRFEAKNGLMKAFNFHNFINISYSCANKHQCWIASKEIEQNKKNSLAYIEDSCDINSQAIIERSHHVNLKPKKYISDVKYLKRDGFEYLQGVFLIIKLTIENDSPSVAFIDKIFNVDEEIIFYLQIFKIKQKIKIYNCLQLEKTNEFIYMKYDEILYKQANFSVIKDNKILLPVRYYHHIFV